MYTVLIIEYLFDVTVFAVHIKIESLSDGTVFTVLVIESLFDVTVFTVHIIDSLSDCDPELMVDCKCFFCTTGYW